MSEFDANPEKGATIGQRLAAFVNPHAEPEGQPLTKANDQREERQETPEGDTDTNPKRRKFKLSDQEIEIDVLSGNPDLVPKGLMMEADYRRKTSEVAELKRTASEKLAELENGLKEAQTLIELDLDELEANTTLKEDDPEEYLRQLDAIKGRIDKYNKHKERVAKQREAEKQERIVKEQELLNQAIPDWLDDGKRDADYKRIVKAWGDAGFSQDEMGEMLDHRHIILARKAALYDELMSQNLDAKLDKTPQKSSKPGAKNSKGISDAVADTRKRLRETGKWHDAGAHFATIFNKR